MNKIKSGMHQRQKKKSEEVLHCICLCNTERYVLKHVFLCSLNNSMHGGFCCLFVSKILDLRSIFLRFP